MKGLFKDSAVAFPKFKPTDRQTIRPGPAVAAMASMSSNLIPLVLLTKKNLLTLVFISLLFYQINITI